MTPLSRIQTKLVIGDPSYFGDRTKKVGKVGNMNGDACAV